MPTIINGSTNAVTFPDGTIQNTAALPLTGGTVTGNVTVGSTATSDNALTVASANNTAAQINLLGDSSATVGMNVKYEGNGNFFAVSSTNAGSLTERMRIDSNGVTMVARTAAYTDGTIGTPIFQVSAVAGTRAGIAVTSASTSSTGMIGFVNPNGTVGSITTSGSGTSYVTTSDYRLKENVAPMTGALDVVQALKPVTYNWKVDGSASQGFIAHELQEVVPECVTGEKDAVDAEGNPQYQGIDTSFLVATLTAAIQELKAELDTVKAELAALKA